MAFDNVTFPDIPLVHGVRREVIDPVNVTGNGTYEYRLKKQEWERYKFIIPTQTMTEAQRNEIISFLAQRGHGLNSFKFVDPGEPIFNYDVLEYASGNLWNLALPYSSTVPGVHPIFNFDPTEMLVDIDNGTSQTVVNSFQINNGVPQVEILGGYTGANVIKLFGNGSTETAVKTFTVRLNSALSSAIVALTSCPNIQSNANVVLPVGHNVQAIELIEVFGEI